LLEADLLGDTAGMFLAGLYRAEQAIADRLVRIVDARLPLVDAAAGRFDPVPTLPISLGTGGVRGNPA
jgi:hypothetical protein